ncbi:V-set domain-containing T-cell activation inhibitor 1 isoform X2 [Scyliorhinus canicula]|uniref:V-set domain-containing T-cell activation inhibitor 1 isoform X1 n=1 Tax=Scyliorhinus canicula TaxID=7830 RepID=UPI0018F69553|nr:V-set domain-containing T-cell activation inhibitor 1 isoform X1 [Scyliorhinus canicula]XP_038657940.1 V-set domain-containing T-cell activation inhibitor 1 isoform X2 [Scyliorhinus canicula]
MTLSLYPLLICLLFSHIIVAFIVSTDQHTAAEVGKQVVLRCTCDSNGDSNPTVIWEKVGVEQTVHLYRGNVDDLQEQHKNYTKRTGLHAISANKGDASLTLKNVNIWDEGKYRCSVSNGNGFGEAFVDLAVWAINAEDMHILWKQDGSGRDFLSCQTSGWYPKPTVSWNDKNGNDLNGVSETTMTRDENGFFHVQYDLKQQHDSSNQYICSVKHKWMAAPERTRAAFTDGSTLIRLDDGNRLDL